MQIVSSERQVRGVRWHTHGSYHPPIPFVRTRRDPPKKRLPYWRLIRSLFVRPGKTREWCTSLSPGLRAETIMYREVLSPYGTKTRLWGTALVNGPGR